MMDIANLRIYTNVELVRAVQSSPDSTATELELASRLDTCLKEISELAAELEEIRSKLEVVTLAL